MVDLLETAYQILDAYRISLPMLLGGAFLLSIAFVFASREAASWFLKTHDLKKDIARVEEAMFQLKGEIRSLQDLLRGRADAAPVAVSAAVPPPEPASEPVFRLIY